MEFMPLAKLAQASGMNFMDKCNVNEWTRSMSSYSADVWYNSKKVIDGVWRNNYVKGINCG